MFNLFLLHDVHWLTLQYKNVQVKTRTATSLSKIWLCTCVRILGTFLCSPRQNNNVKWPNSCCLEKVTHDVNRCVPIRFCDNFDGYEQTKRLESTARFVGKIQNIYIFSNVRCLRHCSCGYLNLVPRDFSLAWGAPRPAPKPGKSPWERLYYSVSLSSLRIVQIIDFTFFFISPPQLTSVGCHVTEDL